MCPATTRSPDHGSSARTTKVHAIPLRGAAEMSQDTELAVLQHLAMEGIAETEEVVDGTGRSESGVVDVLERLESEGHVEEDGFWYLSDTGEERLNEVCRARFDDNQLAEIREVFERFEEFDGRMKDLAETWQELDEHERGPDADPVDEVVDLQTKVESLFADLPADVHAVYEPYVDALSEAVDRLQDGETEYFTATDVDSYHTVWFELHDDLLRTLGEEREE